MESLLILTALACLVAAPVSLGIAIVALRRVTRLERHLRDGAATATGVPGPVASPPPAAGPPPRAWPAFRPRRPRGDLESLLGGQWATWIGVLALFFGTAFFLAIDLADHALAGAPQVALGGLVAAGFAAIGRRWSRVASLRFLGLGLLGGGIALAYLATYAAHAFHGLVPLVVVFPVMLVVAVSGASVALARGSVTLASLTLIGALLTPILLPSSSHHSFAVLPYLIAVNAGSVVVGHRRGWAGFPLASLLGSALLVGIWYVSLVFTSMFSTPASGERVSALLTVGVSWALFAASPLLRSPRTRGWDVFRGIVTAASGILYAAFGLALLDGALAPWRAAFLVVLAVTHLGFAHALRRVRADDPAASVTFHTGVVVLAVAAFVQFDLQWVTFAWTALAGVLLVHGVRRDESSYRLAGLGVLVLAMLRVALVDPIRGAGADFVFGGNGPFLSAMAVVGLIAWTGHAYRSRPITTPWIEAGLAKPLLLLAVALFWWRTTVDVHFAWLGTAWDRADRLVGEQTTFTVVWTLIAVATHTLGVRMRIAAFRHAGVGLLLLTVAKVLFVDTFGARADALRFGPFLSLPFAAGMSLCAGIAVVAFQRARSRDGVDASRPLVLVLFLFLWVMTAEIARAFGGHGADAERSLLLTVTLTWTVYGSALIGFGFLLHRHVLRWSGIVVLALTTLKVFFVDLGALESGYRIAALVGLGVLVLIVSSVYQRRGAGGDGAA